MYYPLANAALALIVSLATLPASAAGTSASDELDALDKQEFNARIERATGCIQARDFGCASRQLSEARSYANGSADRGILQRTMERLELERQLALLDDARQKYSQERAAVEANASATEVELAERRRAEQARAARANAIAEQQNRESRQREAAASRAASPGAAALQGVAETMRDFNKLQQSQASVVQVRPGRAEEVRSRQEDDRHETDRPPTRPAAAQAAPKTDKLAQARQEAEANAKKEAAAKQEAERERSRLEMEKAQKEAAAREKAAQETAKRAEEAAKRQAERNYLTALAQGTRLKAMNCLDGGQYIVGGSLPRMKSEVVACVDMHYRANCPGSAIVHQGAIRNMVGMGTGCFGDIDEITPKLDCKTDQIQVVVTEARSCDR